MVKLWNSPPAFVRDFFEGAVAAAVGGAAAAVLALDLGDATTTTVVRAAIVGAIAAVIAYARHRLEQTQPPTAGGSNSG